MKIGKDILKILSSEAFQKLTNNDAAKIAELNIVIRLLIKLQIPFDVSFSPGTRRTAAAVELTIYINPSTTIDFVISLDSGSGTFDNF